VKGSCFKRERKLKRFQQRNVLGYVVVLVTDPFGDPDPLTIRFFDDNANA
jgi:hypothetical protein